MNGTAHLNGRGGDSSTAPFAVAFLPPQVPPAGATGEPAASATEAPAPDTAPPAEAAAGTATASTPASGPRKSIDGDTVIRFSTAAVVIAVAAFAAIISYSHIYDLGRLHAQAGTAARLLPLSVDGLILAGSLILLHEARSQRPGYWLGRLALWLGIAATLAANVLSGLPSGWESAVVSAWPAGAFIVATEALMGLVRRARSEPLPEAVQQHPAGVPGPHLDNGSVSTRRASVSATGQRSAGARRTAVPGAATLSRGSAPQRTPKRTAETATDAYAATLFAADIAAGRVPSLRAIIREMHIGNDRAKEIRAHLERARDTIKKETAGTGERSQG